MTLFHALLAQTTTTFPLTPQENPSSTAGAIMFFGVTGVILVGGIVLYLRNRPARRPHPEDRS